MFYHSELLVTDCWSCLSPKSLKRGHFSKHSTCLLSKPPVQPVTSIMTSLLTALPNIPSLRKQQLYLEL
jgi:hypothetical protein